MRAQLPHTALMLPREEDVALCQVLFIYSIFFDLYLAKHAEKIRTRDRKFVQSEQGQAILHQSELRWKLKPGRTRNLLTHSMFFSSLLGLQQSVQVNILKYLA